MYRSSRNIEVEDRYMRMMLMFDLPVKTSTDRRNYRMFRKYITEQGFVMMQKSIYTKIVLNSSKVNTTLNNLKLSAPDNGLIQIITITERQYSQMELLIGELDQKVINDRSKVVIL